MSNLKAFGHLAWKDARVVTPFAIALLICLILAQLTVTFVSTLYPPTNGKLETLLAVIGALIPGVFVYAIGPFMVGGEEEKGTLGWLAGLPLSWRAIVLSKLVVSFAFYCLIATTSYALVKFAFHSNTGNFDGAYEARSETVLAYLLYGCFLWIISFLCSYLIRSPVWSLLLVGPVWTVLNILLNRRFEDFFVGYAVSLQDYFNIVFASAVITLSTFWLARTRILRPWTMNNIVHGTSQVFVAYQPPKTIGLNRPSQWTTLLWQQWRQYSPVAFTVLVLFMIPSIILAMGTPWHHGEAGWVVLGTVVVSSILGSMTFYGDAIKTRTLFFGERGLSPTRFWLTRLLLSTVFVLPCLLTAYYVITRSWHAADDVSWIAICFVMWSIGVVSPMMIKRPVLSFFVPAVTVVFAFILLLWFFEIYRGYVWTILLACPVISLASWHLCEPWLSRRLSAGYYSKLFGYAMLALIAPAIGIVVTRVVNAPRVDPHWKSAMLAAVGHAHPNTERSAILSPNVSDTTKEVTVEQLDQELKGTDPIGQHATSTSVLTILNEHKPIDDKALAMKVCLNWSGRVREAMVHSTASPREFCSYAEVQEKWVLDSIMSPEGVLLPKEQIAELLKSFPSKELRRESRLAAIGQMWAVFNLSLDYKNQSKQFAGLNLASYHPWLLFEGWRQNRVIDRAAELMTQEIQSGKNFEAPDTREYLHELLNDSFVDIMDLSNRYRYEDSHGNRYWENSELGWVFWIYSTENQIKILEAKSK